MRIKARRLFARRARGEWATRTAIALLAAVLGYAGVAHSLAQTVQYSDPARSHALAPWDSRLTAALAEKRLIDDRLPAAEPETVRLAKLALRQSPIAVSAIATLGLLAQARGDLTQAQRLFGYSEMLSRRDLTTQLWAIEEAVARNDVDGALRHYDIALRTNNQASDVLFPILMAAIAQPEVRDALVAVLAQHPGWGEYFINYATFNGTDPRANLQLLRKLEQVGWNVPESARSSLINSLIRTGATEEAWAYYVLVKRGTDRRVSRDPFFTAGVDPPSILDWIVNEGVATGSMQRSGQAGLFDFAAPPGAGGTLLQQAQVLPPGSYRLEGHSRGIEQPERSLPYWVLTCRNGGELGRLTVPNSAQNNGFFAGQFTVPERCPDQTLALIARPSDEISGVSGQIDRVRLFPSK